MSLSENTYSAVLNGSNQYFSIDDASQTGLDFGADFSVSIWAKADNLSSVVSGLMGKQASSNLSFQWAIFRTGGVVKHFLYLSTNGSSAMYDGNSDTGVTISDDTWHMYSITRSGTTLKFFTDGVQDGSDITLSSSGALYDGTAPFEVGRDGQSAARHTDGQIDDARVWLRELSEAEISDLYGNSCSFDNGSNLSAHWTLDNVVTDSSGNGNTLTNNNSATFSTDVPFECGTDYIQTCSDVISLSDSLDKIYGTSISVQDTINLSDSENLQAEYNIPVQDGISMSDVVTIQSTFGVSMQDAISLADSAEALNAIIIAVSDAISMSDSLEEVAEYGVALSDTISMSDVATILKGLNVDVSDSVSLSDLVTLAVIIGLELSDTVAISDLVKINDGWNFINKSSDGNDWVFITKETL